MASERHNLDKVYPLTVPGLIGAGVVLRLVGLLSASLWFDEAFSLHQIQQPLFDTVRLALSDYTPPGWDIIAWPWVHLIPGALGLRLPAVLCSIGALWVAWLLIQRWVTHPAARLAALAPVAMLPGFIWTAQDGRCYALLTLLYCLALYYAVTDKKVGMWGACGLLMWTHTTGLILAGSAFVLWLLYRGKLRRVAWAAVLVGVCYLPYLPTLLNRAGTGFPFSSGLTVGGFIGGLWQTLLGGAVNKDLGLWCVLLVLVSGVAGLAMSVVYRRGRLAGVAVLLPLVVMLLMAALGRNVWMYRTIQPMFFILPIWLASALWPGRWQWGSPSNVIPIAWCIMLVWGLLLWSPAARGGGLEDVATRIESEWQPGDVMYYATGYSAETMRIYLDKPIILASAELYSPAHRVYYGWPVLPLDQVQYTRIWLVWDDRNLTTEELRTYLGDLTAGLRPVYQVPYMQTETWSIYLLEGK